MCMSRMSVPRLVSERNNKMKSEILSVFIVKEMWRGLWEAGWECTKLFLPSRDRLADDRPTFL